MGETFADPSRYPYLSVCTTSTHDMNPLRAWWEEDRQLSTRFFREVLHADGDVPQSCEPWICQRIISMHLASPSMFAILPLQDWLAMDEDAARSGPAQGADQHPGHSALPVALPHASVTRAAACSRGFQHHALRHDHPQRPPVASDGRKRVKASIAGTDTSKTSDPAQRPQNGENS